MLKHSALTSLGYHALFCSIVSSPQAESPRIRDVGSLISLAFSHIAGFLYRHDKGEIVVP
jgi:hypothetical protein